jgi:hypothetical protein
MEERLNCEEEIQSNVRMVVQSSSKVKNEL